MPLRGVGRMVECGDSELTFFPEHTKTTTIYKTTISENNLKKRFSATVEKAREFQKSIYFCFIDYAKAFDCVDHNKLENSERDGNTRPPDLPLEKSVCRSGSNS